jgi:membrane protease subunit HflK
MMQTVLGNVSKMLVDQKGSNSLLYLPLDKLIQQSAAQPSAAAPEASRPAPAAGTPEPPATLEPSAARSRGDALRSRDRASEAR